MRSTFLLSVMMSISLQSAQQIQRGGCCDRLSVIVYKTMSCCLRNDYHTLAYSNACWMLRMKLKCREEMQSINQYYLRDCAVIQGQDYPVWVSPLHEAILQGNVQAVEILGAAGANINLCIKSTISDTERAKHQVGCMFIEHLNLTEQRAQQEITEWHRSHYVGLSAIELAKALCKNKHDDLNNNRRNIYKMLSRYVS